MTLSDPMVAFDESGNSGQNLLDSDQPVFVLASVALDTDVAASMVPGQTKELKFARLKRSPSGCREILDILNSPKLDNERVCLSAIHKRFMVITKLVDLLVEPLFWESGKNLYERGQNLALANMLYYCMPTFIGENRFSSLLHAFASMVRTRSADDIDSFYRLLRQGYRNLSDDTFRADMGMLLDTRRFVDACQADWDGTTLDPAIPAFVLHCGVWTKRMGRMFSIVHDSSKPLEQKQLMLEAMMSAEPPSMIGYDRRKMLFPFSASGIQFEDSRTFPQIQIADIVASSAAYYLRLAARGQQDSFAADLLKTQVLRNFSGSVWPTPLVTPEELGTSEVGGIDASQCIGEYVAQRLGEIPLKVPRHNCKPKSTQRGAQ